jgi:hypothetical protein
MIADAAPQTSDPAGLSLLPHVQYIAIAISKAGVVVVVGCDYG